MAILAAATIRISDQTNSGDNHAGNLISMDAFTDMSDSDCL